VVGQVLMYSVNALFAAALILPVMLSLSWRLTLLSLISMPFAAIATRFFSKRIYDRFEKVQEYFGRVCNRAQEAFSGVRTIRAYTKEQSEIESFRLINRQYVNHRLKLIRLT